jgi:hypothetical protein
VSPPVSHFCLFASQLIRGRAGRIILSDIIGSNVVSFIELLQKTKAEVCGHTSPTKSRTDEQISWVELLRRTKAEVLARSEDPWRLRLGRVRGKTGYDGVERIAALMREFGWTPMKARGLCQSGFRDQVRGYARASAPRAQ